METNPITRRELTEEKTQGEIGGKLGLGLGNLKRKLRMREGERWVETGETQWKPASNQEEGKRIEKKIGN